MAHEDPRGGRVDGSPAGRLEPLHGRRRRVPEGGRSKVNTPPVVSPEEWKTAREELLVKEKEHTRARDALAAERRRMPWMALEKEYSFEGPNGPATLADLFEGRRHLIARDVTLAFASRAPQAELQKLKERHGWEHIPWYTITDDWDKDFGVDEWHGHNAFIREGNQIYRTYFIDSRGDEAMGTTWSYLDMAPLGRQEDWEDSPEGYPQTAPYGWWDYNDAYGA